jgi:O-antigen/teichoic acid export membrane protein
MIVIACVVVAAGYHWEVASVVLAVSFAKATESASDVIYGLMQKHERLDKTAISLIVKGVGSVTGLALAMWVTGDIFYATLVLAGWWTVVFLFYDCPVGSGILRRSTNQAESSRPAWNLSTLRRLALLSLPLGLVMMLVGLNSNVPRYFVAHYVGEAALGYFAAMAYLIVAGSVVVDALGLAAAPRLSKYYVHDRQAFASLVRKMVGVAAALGCAAILTAVFLGREILSLIYRPEYAQHVNVLIWLMVAAALAYLGVPLSWAVTASRTFAAQLPLFCLVTATVAATSFLLIRPYGLLGAAYALLAGETVKLLGLALLLLSAVAPERCPGLSLASAPRRQP